MGDDKLAHYTTVTGTDMKKTLLRLYPPPALEVSLKGLYLAHRLHESGTSDRPFVYANFLTSLDGRIALEDSATGQTYLPKNLTTADDFRLFMELHAQADCLITHGGYLRALEAQHLGNILQIGATDANRDLAEWRVNQGLTTQPAVVIASASLDFPMSPSIQAHGQPCYIATGEKADPKRVEAWEKQGYTVLRAGPGTMVEGDELVRILGRLGYRTLYLIAGPNMLDTMVRAGRLARLYQTISHQLLGGEAFRTLVPGPVIGPIGHVRLRTLYYDRMSQNGVGQWFCQFENAEPSTVNR